MRELITPCYESNQEHLVNYVPNGTVNFFCRIGVDHVYRASHATEARDCTVCIDCDEDECGVPMACCMGLDTSGVKGSGVYTRDGDFLTAVVIWVLDNTYAGTTTGNISFLAKQCFPLKPR